MQHQERYREFPQMEFCGIKVGRIGAHDIFFLRTARVKWQDLEDVIVVKLEEPAP